MFLLPCWIDSKDWTEGNEALGNNSVKTEGLSLPAVWRNEKNKNKRLAGPDREKYMQWLYREIANNVENIALLISREIGPEVY